MLHIACWASVDMTFNEGSYLIMQQIVRWRDFVEFDLLMWHFHNMRWGTLLQEYSMMRIPQEEKARALHDFNMRVGAVAQAFRKVMFVRRGGGDPLHHS